jgi:hypothetical protein
MIEPFFLRRIEPNSCPLSPRERARERGNFGRSYADPATPDFG